MRKWLLLGLVVLLVAGGTLFFLANDRRTEQSPWVEERVWDVWGVGFIPSPDDSSKVMAVELWCGESPGEVRTNFIIYDHSDESIPTIIEIREGSIGMVEYRSTFYWVDGLGRHFIRGEATKYVVYVTMEEVLGMETTPYIPE